MYQTVSSIPLNTYIRELRHCQNEDGYRNNTLMFAKSVKILLEDFGFQKKKQFVWRFSLALCDHSLPTEEQELRNYETPYIYAC